MRETDQGEKISARAIERNRGFGFRRWITRSLKLYFPLCPTCAAERKRPSAKITAFTVGYSTFGRLFTNEEYAKLFAQANSTTYSEFEDDGRTSAMR